MGAKTVPRGANVLLTFIFLHFAPIRSVVQNPHCHFSMDEPIGSFSPVQGGIIEGSGYRSFEVHYIKDVTRGSKLTKLSKTFEASDQPLPAQNAIYLGVEVDERGRRIIEGSGYRSFEVHYLKDVTRGSKLTKLSKTFDLWQSYNMGRWTGAVHQQFHSIYN